MITGSHKQPEVLEEWVNHWSSSNSYFLVAAPGTSGSDQKARSWTEKESDRLLTVAGKRLIIIHQIDQRHIKRIKSIESKEKNIGPRTKERRRRYHETVQIQEH